MRSLVNEWIMVSTVPAVKESIDSARSFLQEAWAEFRKVQWPSMKEVRAATLVVISLVVLIALYLFAVDWILSWFFQMFLER
jgi:preprotein translocase subunit SecE